MSRRLVLLGAGMALLLATVGCAVPATGTPAPILESPVPTEQVPQVVVSPTPMAGAEETPEVETTPTTMPGDADTTMTPGETPGAGGAEMQKTATACTETPPATDP